MASDTNANISENNREPCFWCVKALKWIPVLFVMTIVVWSYYAYVVQLCYYTVESSGETAIYLILFHLLFLMFCWSYWQTIFTGIGTVPAKFKLSSTDLQRLLNAETEDQYLQILEEFSRNLPLRNRTISGGVRYCAKCAHVKPDRAHHCSMCGYCVLKMDHHCPWVNNCVNFFNYKYFILFLGYALLYCLYISITSFPYFVLFWKGDIKGMGRFNIFFLFFVAIIFVASLLSFFIYHLYLVFHNRTTIEAFRAPVFQSGPQKNGYDLGYYKNFQEVFGNQPRSWLLPVFTSLGDGVVFPVQIQHSNVYNSMGTTPNSIGDGLTYPQPEIDEDAEQLLPSKYH